MAPKRKLPGELRQPKPMVTSSKAQNSPPPDINQGRTWSKSLSRHKIDSSLTSACDFILNIDNYIPVGCLRLERNKCQVPVALWESCVTWHWFRHPRENYIGETDAEPSLHYLLQDMLFKTSQLHSYQQLHQAGWIRLSFRVRNSGLGQIRIYILPEDTGHKVRDRNEKALRSSLQRLMAELDIAWSTWDGQWLEWTPVSYLDPALNQEKTNEELSLFFLFNTLPSPAPDPSVVQDDYAKSAMEKILSGNVRGLKTNMLAYQRRSAAMMLQREAQPALLMDPRLRKQHDQNGVPWYCDIVAGTCRKLPQVFEAPRGGICAENMGLGKTLICLALILATREQSSQIPAEYSVGTIPVRARIGSLLEMSAATIGRRGIPWRRQFEELGNGGEDFWVCKDAIRRNVGHYFIPGTAPRRVSRRPIGASSKIYLSTATLIVVPANLVRQWELEIAKHTSGLKVLVMINSKDELPDASTLSEYDIILFSRLRFEKESRDGSDEQGRRESSLKTSHMSPCYTKSHGGGDYGCFGASTLYRSPLRHIHFKRLITDEGHTMGNSSNSAKSNAVCVVDFLHLSSRWIVSGTPTQGLYGADRMPELETSDGIGQHRLSSSQIPFATEKAIDAEQERKDLEKLGNIATMYLKSRPWANRDANDSASWAQYVMQPRHGNKSYGSLECLRNTLEGMIIRHRPTDVEKDIVLPPLHQRIVYLEGSYLDKLSLNMFSLMITSNAVTSERKDVDYLFHPKQKQALGHLFSNLRQASFFWCGFSKSNVTATIDIAKKFLAQGEIYVSDEDRMLLERGVEVSV